MVVVGQTAIYSQSIRRVSKLLPNQPNRRLPWQLLPTERAEIMLLTIKDNLMSPIFLLIIQEMRFKPIRIIVWLLPLP